MNKTTEVVHVSIQALNDLFGTDQAMGVRSAGEDEGGRSLFPDDSSAVVCTNFAQQVKNNLPGHTVNIVGFNVIDNPHCQVANDWHEEGHDFAIVDHQFLVDSWPKLVAGMDKLKVAYDLQNADDCILVAEIYQSAAENTVLQDGDE